MRHLSTIAILSIVVLCSGAMLSNRAVAETCFLNQHQLSTFLRQDPFYAIDVRSAADYNAVHPKNAISIAKNSIQDQIFLRDRPVVLIGELLDPTLETTCVTLRSKGFQVLGALPLGIYSWVNAGGAIVPNQESLSHPMQLPVMRVLENRENVSWLLVFLYSTSEGFTRMVRDAFGVESNVTIVNLSRSEQLESKATIEEVVQGFATVPHTAIKPRYVALFAEKGDREVLSFSSSLLRNPNLFLVREGSAELSLFFNARHSRANSKSDSTINRCTE